MKGEGQTVGEGQVTASLGKFWSLDSGRCSCPLTRTWAGGCSKLPGDWEKGSGKWVREGPSLSFSGSGKQGTLSFQEQGNEKTNNGTHYKLQLLYSNGERPECPRRPLVPLFKEGS